MTDVYKAVCGVDVPLGEGRAIVLTATSGPVDRALSSLGVTPGLRLEGQRPGAFATTTSTEMANGRYTSDAPATVTVALDLTTHRSGRHAPRVAPVGHVLPLGLYVAGRRLEWASAEIASVAADGTIHFLPGLTRTVARRLSSPVCPSS